MKRRLKRKMQLAVLWTGGKDSNLALHRVLKTHHVKYLVSMIPLREDSWMFHYPNIQNVEWFAKAIPIPLVKKETQGRKELEMTDLKQVIKTLDISGLVAGTIASTYQKTRMEQMCQQLNIELLTPLWNEKPLNLLTEMLDINMEIIITAVYAHGLDKELLGMKIDDKMVNLLLRLHSKFGISIVGEGGEYETLVLNAPCYEKRIEITLAEKILETQGGYFFIKKVKLHDK